MQNQVGVFNLALSLCGHRSSVAAPDEASREAEICSLWFPVVRDMVLASAHWPSARQYSRLARINELTGIWEPGQPDPRFQFSYALPSDCVHPRYMADYSPFLLGSYQGQTRVMSNLEQPILIYTGRNTTISSWEPMLYNAISHVLAAYVVMPLTGKLERLKTLRTLALELLEEARTYAANSDDFELQSIPDELAQRGTTGLLQPSRFIYPFQSIGFPQS
jgi:hypothetical protein